MSAIEATTAGFKDMADGTVRFFFDVEPRHAGPALELFRVRGIGAALAALKPEHLRKPEPEKPKGGERAKWVAMRCSEEAFQQWLSIRWPACWVMATGPFGADRAASVIRSVCKVQSRAELDTDQTARARFDELIRRPWMERGQLESEKA